MRFRTVIYSIFFAIAMTANSLAQSCFGGDTDRWIGVDICSKEVVGCFSFCIPTEKWGTDESNETVRRFIFAVSNGKVSLEYIRKVSKNGFDDRGKFDVGNVRVISKPFFVVKGTVY